MKRDLAKFLTGAAAAMSYVHIAYAVAAAKGIISVPIFRGREWGVGKMWIEAVVYGIIAAGLGYLGWRPEPREVASPTTMTGTNGSVGVAAATAGARS